MRRTGSRRRPSATPRRPATSTGWHGWSSFSVSSPTKAVARRRPSAGSTGWKRTGHSTGTECSRSSARSSLRCGAGLNRRTVGPRRPNTRATTAPCLTAALRSTPGWPCCVASVVTGGWRGCAQMRSSRSERSPVGASSARMPCWYSRCRSGWPARSTRPTTCSPTLSRRASSWERTSWRWWRSPSAPRSRSDEGDGSRPRSSPSERCRSPAVRGWTSTPPARSSARWRPASHSTAGKPSARTSSSPGRNACGRGSPTRCRPWPSRPAWSLPGPT